MRALDWMFEGLLGSRRQRMVELATWAAEKLDVGVLP